MNRVLRAVVIGSSAGGLNALRRVLSSLPSNFPVPIGIVQHRDPGSPDLLSGLLDSSCDLDVVEAVDKQVFRPGKVCIAPANYHLLVENERELSLSVAAPVDFARPSIDLFFESASYIFSDSLVGVVLTGASADGTSGLKAIRENGGYAIVQDPSEAEYPLMPESAIRGAGADEILRLDEIGNRLTELCIASLKRDR